MRTVALALTALFAGCGGTAPPADRPNVLLIVCDDVGWGDLGCYGSADARTPHLDALAREGVRLTDFYVGSPVCSASRASLLTGRAAERHGVDRPLRPGARLEGLALDEQILPQWLGRGGYATGLVGKWHLGDQGDYLPTRRGFQEFFGMLNGSSGYFQHDYKGTPDLWRGEEPVQRDGEYSTFLYTREAQSFVQRHAGEPWFLVLAYNAAHLDDQRRVIPAPPEYSELFATLDASPERRSFLAALAAMDDGVGLLLDTLQRTGQAGRTLVVLLSDNGPMPDYGSTGPFRGIKDSLDEGGIRVPCLLRWPGRLPAAAVVSAPVNAMDLTVSMLAATGTPPPGDRALDGLDVLDVLAGRAEPPDRALCWDFQSRLTMPDGTRIGTAHDRVVRRGHWRLTLQEGGAELLHDLDVDPGQAHDVAAEHPDVLLSLRADFEEHQSRVAEDR